MSLRASMRVKSDELFRRWITEQDVMTYLRESLTNIQNNTELSIPPPNLGVRACNCVIALSSSNGTSSSLNGGSSSRSGTSRQRAVQSPRGGDSQFPYVPFTAPLAPPSSPRSPRKQHVAAHTQHVGATTSLPSSTQEDDRVDLNRNSFSNGPPVENGAVPTPAAASQSTKPTLTSTVVQSGTSDASSALKLSVADQLLKNRSATQSADDNRHDNVTLASTNGAGTQPEKTPAGTTSQRAASDTRDTPKVLTKQNVTTNSGSPQNTATASRPNSGKLQSAASVIPRFYFPNGVPPPAPTVSNELKLVVEAFAKFDGRVRKAELGEFLRACRVPVYWKQAVWSYVQALQTDTVKHGYVLKDTFIPLWSSLVKTCHDDASRFVRLLTCGSRDHLVTEDLVPLIQDVVDSHPGLSFLHDAKDFHLRYVQTVIARLFYVANASWSGRLTAVELRRCNFLAMLTSLQDEEDVNNVTDFFSYEHFYVIYCKFWELDLDHDLVIDHNDLRRYQNGALSNRVTARIFSGAVIRNQLQKQDKMTYQDFVWFLISEVDKRHPRSIEYWFRVMDLDGDGVLSMYELEYFYEEQVKRMETLGITETLPFQDCLCQVIDMVRPQSRLFITLADLKHSRHLCDVFFDTFVNVEKYLENEQRDPFANVRDFAEDSDAANSYNAPGAAWNRYAAGEYEVLVAQENEQQTNTTSAQQSFSIADSPIDRLRNEHDDLDDDMLDLNYKMSSQDRFEPNRAQRIDPYAKDAIGGIVVEKDSNKSKSPVMSTTSLTSGGQRRKS